MYHKTSEPGVFLPRIKDHRFLLATLMLAVVIVALSSVAVVSFDDGAYTVATAADGAVADSDSPWGIEVIGVRSTAAGYMLEFRYRVMDAGKAAALFNRKTQPYLIHGASGKVLGVPNTAKVGPLRNANTPQEGRTYWMFFGNTGHLVSVGDKVTVTIGEFVYEDLIVE